MMSINPIGNGVEITTRQALPIVDVAARADVAAVRLDRAVVPEHRLRGSLQTSTRSELGARLTLEVNEQVGHREQAIQTRSEHGLPVG